ncbi:Holliday junction ATP-dependent DNA helicase ruvB, partial [Candidatus Arthromitus sp. SFB-5]
MDGRLVNTSFSMNDSKEYSLRPVNFNEYIGQSKVKSNLKVFIEAANMRGDALDHVLFYGPPGLGKTTLASIISKEMNSSIRITSGPAIEKPGDLAAILTSLEEKEILFIDEIHRLSRTVEEILYSAMEDYALDIIIGKGPQAKSIRIDLAKFTLVGATTRLGLLTSPLRDRFGVLLPMDYYTNDELKEIIIRSSKILFMEIT